MFTTFSSVFAVSPCFARFFHIISSCLLSFFFVHHSLLSLSAHILNWQLDRTSFTHTAFLLLGDSWAFCHDYCSLRNLHTNESHTSIHHFYSHRHYLMQFLMLDFPSSSHCKVEHCHSHQDGTCRHLDRPSQRTNPARRLRLQWHRLLVRSRSGSNLRQRSSCSCCISRRSCRSR